MLAMIAVIWSAINIITYSISVMAPQPTPLQLIAQTGYVTAAGSKVQCRSEVRVNSKGNFNTTTEATEEVYKKSLHVCGDKSIH